MKSPKNNCTGLAFRGFNNSYFDSKKLSFNNKTGFRLLKRSSCDCEECKELLKCLKNDFGHDYMESVYFTESFGLKGEIEHDGLYRAKVSNWHCDSDEISGEFYCWPEKIEMKLIK